MFLNVQCFTSIYSCISFLEAGYSGSKPDVITLLEQGKEPCVAVRDVTGRQYPGELRVHQADGSPHCQSRPAGEGAYIGFACCAGGSSQRPQALGEKA